MPNQELIEYIKKMLEQGLTKEQIKNSLLSSGWPEAEIDAALSAIQTVAGGAVGGASAGAGVGIGGAAATTSIAAWKIIVASLVGLAVVGGGVYYVIQRPSDSNVNPDDAGSLTIDTNDQPMMNVTDQDLVILENGEAPLGNVVLADCGEDFNCFANAADDCKPSKVRQNTSITTYDMTQKTKSLLEIRGEKDNRCIFYMEIESVELDLPDYMKNMISEEQKAQIIGDTEGKWLACKFDNKVLASMIERWGQNKFSTSDLSTVPCDGTFYNN